MPLMVLLILTLSGKLKNKKKNKFITIDTLAVISFLLSTTHLLWTQDGTVTGKKDFFRFLKVQNLGLGLFSVGIISISATTFSINQVARSKIQSQWLKQSADIVEV